MKLDVLIPSLLLTAPLHKLLPPPIVPVLEKLLARADRQSEVVPTGSSWLCRRWGVGAPCPIAPLLAAYDGFDTSSGGWMFAAPVHLKPNGDRLDLFKTDFLELSGVETAEFIATLNTHFADRNLQFCARTPDRWYVRCSPAEIPLTTSPHAARTGSLIDSQPKSSGTLDWRSLQNESQMLFFAHRVNDAREAMGKPTVSGVWFWGGGLLPELKTPAYDRVVANSPLSIQLATNSGIEVQPLSWAAVQSAKGNVLAVIDSCNELAGSFDLPGWARELERLDDEWFLPMSAALGRGAIERLRLHVPDGEFTHSYQITRRQQLLRFWRSAVPLSSYA